MGWNGRSTLIRVTRCCTVVYSTGESVGIHDIAQLVVVEGDEPRALLDTMADPLYDWAERTFAKYKQDASPLLVTQ